MYPIMMLCNAHYASAYAFTDDVHRSLHITIAVSPQCDPLIYMYRPTRTNTIVVAPYSEIGHKVSFMLCKIKYPTQEIMTRALLTIGSRHAASFV